MSPFYTTGEEEGKFSFAWLPCCILLSIYIFQKSAESESVFLDHKYGRNKN